MKKKTLFIVSVLLVVFLFTSLVFGASEKGKKPEGKVYNFTMVIYGTTGNPFWAKVVAGAKEAASAIGCNVNIPYANNDPQKQVNIIETAIANKVDGIGIIINVDDAYDSVVEKAIDNGFDDKDVFYNLAIAAYMIKKFRKAYIAAKKYLELDPTDVDMKKLVLFLQKKFK